MEEIREKRKKSILRKTWERCKSLGHVQPQNAPFSPTPLAKSKSWSSFCPPSPLPNTPSSPRWDRWGSFKKLRAGPHVPSGCFSIYVGPEKQRFVIKVEWTSHPLFKMLLEEAELEYGFHSDGPIVLPCDVQVFIKVLFEMDNDDDDNISNLGCRFPRSRSSYHLFSPSRLVSMNQV